MNGVLPTGWTRTTLGSVCTKPQYGWTTKATRNSGEVRLLRTTDITSGSIAWESVPFCTDAPEDLEKYALHNNDIVISRAGSVGASILVRDPPAPAVFASYLIRFATREGVNPRYVAYFLLTSEYWRSITERSSGIALPNVNAKKLASIGLPLAPPKQQAEIVAKIDELFSSLDAGVAALERAKANLKRYRAAVLKAAVEGRLTPEEDSERFDRQHWRPIDDAIAELQQGWSPKCDRHPVQRMHEWGVIKTSSVLPMLYLDKANKRLPDSLEARPELEVHGGDILITRAGPRRRCGITCLVRDTRERLMICDKVYRLRAHVEVARPAFLELILNSPPLIGSIERIKTGSSESGLNLTQSRFRALEVPLPSLEIQDAVIAEVERRLSVCDAVSRAVDLNTEREGGLRQGVLQSAFSGSLVTAKTE